MLLTLKKLEFSILFLSFLSYSFANETEEDRFIIGKSFFDKPWVAAPASTTARDGLGPLFNARSCAACHPKNNRGNIKVITLDSFSHLYGSQIATNSTNNVPKEADVKINNSAKLFKYPDGREIILTKPQAELLNLAYGPITSTLTIRTPPKLTGVGQINQISQSDIIKNTKNGGKLPTGRFGLTAKHPNLTKQVADAAFNDMSLTNFLYPNDNCTQQQTSCLQAPKSKEFDITTERLNAIVYYLEESTKTVKNIKPIKLFTKIGCENCHRSSYDIKEGTIYPYSDFLLYNLGDGYFRTAPLWQSNKQKTFMHDSRAKTIEEAILWHNGAANKAKNNFINLDLEQREKIINFIQSL